MLTDPDHGSWEHRSAWTPSNPRPGILSPGWTGLPERGGRIIAVGMDPMRHGSRWRARSGGTGKLPCRSSATGWVSDPCRYFFSHLFFLHL